MSVFGAVVDPDGTVVLRHIDGFDDMRRACGGWVESTPVLNERPILVICNDEGKLRGLEANPIASAFGGLYPHDTIVGNAVIVGRGVDGEPCDLPADLAEELADVSVLFGIVRRKILGTASA